MRVRTGSNTSPGRSWNVTTLPGHRLRFNKRALRPSLPATIGFANMEPDPQGAVEGILYEFPDAQLAQLDQAERHPEHYDRVEVTVEVDGERHRCWTYRARPEVTADGLVPSRNYIDHILTARDFLSEQYYSALDLTRTFHGPCGSCGCSAEAIFIREGERLSMVCQPCREARLLWGDTLGRRLSVSETGAVMQELVRGGEGFGSVRELVDEAVRRGLLQR